MIVNLLTALLLNSAVTAEARLPSGTIIEASHISGSAEDVDAFVGRQVTRTIFPGRVVTWGDTKDADLVGRNEVVRVVATKGPLRIETKARALGAGAQGDEIMVMNLESRRTISAIVIGPNEVEVAL